MQQVKIFLGIEGASGELSDEINEWIRESEVKVLQVSGNIAPQATTGSGPLASLPGAGASSSRAPSDIMVVVLYEI